MGEDGFAARMLKRYGWSEGTGLGKHRDGTTTAYCPSRRDGTGDEKMKGVGTAAAQFEPWWDDVYAKAAANFVVGAKQKRKRKKKPKEVIKPVV